MCTFFRCQFLCIIFFLNCNGIPNKIKMVLFSQSFQTLALRIFFYFNNRLFVTWQNIEFKLLKCIDRCFARLTNQRKRILENQFPTIFHDVP